MTGFCYNFSSLPSGFISDQEHAINETLRLVVSVRGGMELLDGLSFNDTLPWTFVPPTPYVEDIVPVMNRTAQDILGIMKGKFDSRGCAYVFNALAFLPDDRSDRQCRQFSEESFVDVGHRNLNFVVFYANASSKDAADEAWGNLTDKIGTGEAIMDQVFAKSNDGLCGRLDVALKDSQVDTTTFRGGIAAVKCGYEFVWYELGYTYFYAAYGSTGYKWEKKGGAYDAECGQLFFFP